MGKHPRPTNILLHKKSRVLAVDFDDGSHFDLSCEYLRVFSPSAEVRGHGPGQEILQHGKENVGICLLYTSPSPRDQRGSRMPSSA